MPYTGMIGLGMDHYEAPTTPPKHTKRNTKKSKMAKNSRRNNRKH